MALPKTLPSSKLDQQYNSITIKQYNLMEYCSFPATSPMIDLYTYPTPNGRKPAIMLEEVGLPYTVKKIDLSLGEQFNHGGSSWKRTILH
jgi:hypothetical protein